MNRIPYITLSILAACLLIHTLGLADSWQWSRHAGLRDGWTALTSQLTHWSTSHLLWNMLAFGMLGVWVECLDRAAMRRGLLWSAGLVIPAVAWGMPELDTYRGLSGMASMLFILSACLLWREKKAPALRVMAGIAILAFTGKCTYEWLAGSAAFANLGPDVLPCPLAHLAGGLAGWLGMYARRPKTPGLPSSQPIRNSRHKSEPVSNPTDAGMRTFPALKTHISNN